MPPTFPAGPLALALLAQSPAAAEPPRPEECESASPRVELTAESSGVPTVVCGSPHTSTTLRFDSVLAPQSVRILGRERFEDVAVGQKTLTVVPPADMLPGERLEVEVCFADGLLPACARFVLVGHPGLGMHQVDVFRQPLPVASLVQAVREAEADALQCRAEVRQLRAGLQAPDGLRGVIASGLVDVHGGIAVRDLSEEFTLKEGNTLVPIMVTSYRSWERVAVEVHLKNPGTEPWAVAGAVLRGAKGEVLKPLALWTPEPILPAEPGRAKWGRVAVEVQATAEEARGAYTLTRWDAERTRTVTLGNVTFP